MKVTPTAIPDVLLIEPQVFGDHRGYFVETWQQARYAEHDIGPTFVQDNQAASGHGILRGLHIQNPYGQGKLVQVIVGAVFDVAVDVRRGSPSFGQWVGAELSEANKHQLWVPPGFLHGYLVTSEQAIFSYKCTDTYHPETQFAVRWDDPEIGIDWPSGVAPVLSEKDAQAPSLREIASERLPVYSAD
ncbi:dTDP-4-dehydrorhamnose 3,5-epimerase [Halochromatium glycolicum]|uniref:dTDP-4-dehydrorhamnose 3,5-epimerase n=1 Tax=Halochromatium glycolicum TaxID=85075 RepID=A0AAJ0X7K3_9GAMM|nr:dTDP-4-dehydrorhamnose 3,5-epimerase [Halochromatium glycolicum]MBK1703131.1 dTDP-4-dehydrorhamnose 3,5-epimerase [Halochromatium glycolicum]